MGRPHNNSKWHTLTGAPFRGLTSGPFEACGTNYVVKKRDLQRSTELQISRSKTRLLFSVYPSDALSILPIFSNIFQIYNHISQENILVMHWVYSKYVSIYTKYILIFHWKIVCTVFSKYIIIFHWCPLQIYSCDALSMGESRKFGLGGDSKDSQHIINNQLKRPVLLQKKTHDQQSNLAIIVYHDIKPILWCFIQYFWSKKLKILKYISSGSLRKYRRGGLVSSEFDSEVSAELTKECKCFVNN